MFRRRRKHQDFAAEIRAHLELETDRLREEGPPDLDARPQQEARRNFGNVAAVQEQFYESRRYMWLEHLWRDVHYAIGTLRRAPAFTLAAIVSLALGIGANTAIFSAVDEILLRPVSVPEPHRLAQVYSFNRKTATYVSTSYPDYADYRQRAQSFQHLAAYMRLPLNTALGNSGTERITVEAVTDNYFDMLMLPPLAGRMLRAEDDAAGSPLATMIGEELWHTRFHADPQTIGKVIRIEGYPFTVVGIVPNRLSGMNLNWATPPHVWIPLHKSPLVLPRMPATVFENRSMIMLVLTGRLRAGVSTARAQAELQTIAAAVAQNDSSANSNFTAMVFPLSRSKFWPSYRTAITNSLVVFSVACGLVLLLACANVSNLLLERALSRRREFAVRLAIGASRSRLVRQLLTESLTLAVPSCAAALLVAQGLMKLLLRFPNALGLPLSLDLTVEPRALWFCVALSIATAVLFGLAPALQATRPEILPSLKQSGSALPGSGRDWFRGSLVMLQVAFSTILLVGGGLFVRSLTKAYSVDLGFRSSNLWTAAFNITGQGTEASQRLEQSQRALIRELSAMPGILAASTSSHQLLGIMNGQTQVDSGATPQAIVSTESEYTGPGYLTTLGIPLLSGREFSSRDAAGSPPVAIVNRALATRLWPASSAAGQTLWVHDRAGARTPVTVIGVARDAKYDSVWEDSQPHLYLADWQSGQNAYDLDVRSNLKPADVAAAVRQVWARLEPSTSLYDFQTGDERVNLFLTPQRVAAGIFGAFGVLAIVLASVGLYSLVAYSVLQQRREIGIRIAIGAPPRAVLAAVLRTSMRLTAAGLVLGVIASLLLMRYLATQVKNVSPYDGATYVAVASILAVVALVAALVPARRAMRVDPMTALRSE
jgi:predicted permease